MVVTLLCLVGSGVGMVMECGEVGEGREWRELECVVLSASCAARLGVAERRVWEEEVRVEVREGGYFVMRCQEGWHAFPGTMNLRCVSVGVSEERRVGGGVVRVSCVYPGDTEGVLCNAKGDMEGVECPGVASGRDEL